MTNNKPCLVLVGSPMENQQLVGPFESFDEAEEWCLEIRECELFTWIVPLTSPENFNAD